MSSPPVAPKPRGPRMAVADLLNPSSLVISMTSTRSRSWILLIVLSLILLLWSYIYCVSMVVYNYSWWVVFSGTVEHATLEAAKGTPQVVPRILHQTWKDKDIPQKWKAAQKSCQDLHPDYEYRLWTDADARELIARRFPWFIGTYDGYTHNIQRADALRYFVLYEYGGIYVDLDILCKKKLDPLLHFNFTAPKTYPMGVSNDIMAAQKRDPFSHRLIHHLKDWDHWFFVKYATVMFSTGPMFVTVQYVLHHMKKGVFVLPTNLYGKYEKGPDALMEHLHGSSWHGNDAKGVFFIEHHWKALLAIAGVALVVAGWLLLRSYGGVERSADSTVAALTSIQSCKE